MILESVDHPDSVFLTLTYDENCIPEGNTVLSSDFNEWIDRLRHRKGLEGIRYFGCGEYGDRTSRPHYHALLFGVSALDWEANYADTWEKGFSAPRIPSIARLRYICKYVTKRMTGKDDERLNGRMPEFARASRKPPLGKPGIDRMVLALKKEKGQRMLLAKGNVPNTFRHRGCVYPISLYWRKYLQKELGIDPDSVDVDWTVSLDEQEKAKQKADKERLFYERRLSAAKKDKNYL